MSVSLIYARSENYCIGYEGDLPWELPEEFAHFTRTTAGAVVIMGRKTYQDHNSYLSGRLNIVITRSQDLPLAPKVLRASSLSEAIALTVVASEEIFVIGGSALFREALPMATTVYETVVHANINGDTYIDPFDFKCWDTKVLAKHAADAAHAYEFSIYRHIRNLPTDKI